MSSSTRESAADILTAYRAQQGPDVDDPIYDAWATAVAPAVKAFKAAYAASKAGGSGERDRAIVQALGDAFVAERTRLTNPAKAAAIEAIVLAGSGGGGASSRPPPSWPLRLADYMPGDFFLANTSTPYPQGGDDGDRRVGIVPIAPGAPAAEFVLGAVTRGERGEVIVNTTVDFAPAHDKPFKAPKSSGAWRGEAADTLDVVIRVDGPDAAGSDAATDWINAHLDAVVANDEAAAAAAEKRPVVPQPPPRPVTGPVEPPTTWTSDSGTVVARPRVARVRIYGWAALTRPIVETAKSGAVWFDGVRVEAPLLLVRDASGGLALPPSLKKATVFSMFSHFGPDGAPVARTSYILRAAGGPTTRGADGVDRTAPLLDAAGRLQRAAYGPHSVARGDALVVVAAAHVNMRPPGSKSASTSRVVLAARSIMIVHVPAVTAGRVPPGVTLAPPADYDDEDRGPPAPTTPRGAVSTTGPAAAAASAADSAAAVNAAIAASDALMEATWSTTAAVADDLARRAGGGPRSSRASTGLEIVDDIGVARGRALFSATSRRTAAAAAAAAAADDEDDADFVSPPPRAPTAAPPSPRKRRRSAPAAAAEELDE